MNNTKWDINNNPIIINKTIIILIYFSYQFNQIIVINTTETNGAITTQLLDYTTWMNRIMGYLIMDTISY